MRKCWVALLGASLLSATEALGGFSIPDVDVMIIAPKRLESLWQTEYKAKMPEIFPGVRYAVIGTDQIYGSYAYPYGAGLPCRNPAESIRAFIKDQHEYQGTQYFILGGPWIDAQNLGETIKLATGETLSVDNAIPGVKVKPRDNFNASPSDLYFACLEDESKYGNTYAWDADGDGVYLNRSSLWHDETTKQRLRHDLTADVVVSRMPLVTSPNWKNADGSVCSQTDLLKGYVAKLRRANSSAFTGEMNYGMTGYLITESTTPSLGVNERYVQRRECEFFDRTLNMFDPLRNDDRFWLAESISRRRVREQIAANRPVWDVSMIQDFAWTKGYASLQDAKDNSWNAKDHALRFYYAHGAAGGGHFFGVGDFWGTVGETTRGVTLLDDCAGPCETGELIFTDQGGVKLYGVNYQQAAVTCPFGGAIATVNNSTFGVGDGTFPDAFNTDMSFRFANNILEAFVISNTTVGAAWQVGLNKYVNEGHTGGDTAIWILSELMLAGDPMSRLPVLTDKHYTGTAADFAATDKLTIPASATDDLYTELPAGTRSAVRSVAVEGSATFANATPLRVMGDVTVGGAGLTLAGEGGVGGTVRFTDATGTLTLAGDAPLYVGGLANGKLSVSGSNKTLDFDNFALSGAGDLNLQAGAGVILRSSVEGSFSKIGRNLYLRGNSTVTLATYNAFGSTKGTIYLGTGDELVIAANPYYHDGSLKGESLNADITVMSGKVPKGIRVAKGGIYAPATTLSAAFPYVVEGSDGLKGDITLPKGGKLTLETLPLKNVNNLNLANAATLIVPAGTTNLDGLFAGSGRATIAAGAAVYAADDLETPLNDTTQETVVSVANYSATFAGTNFSLAGQDITLGATSSLTATNTASADQTSVNWSTIRGEGTVAIASTDGDYNKWVCLPDRAHRFAESLSFTGNGWFILPNDYAGAATPFNVRNLSGEANFRVDWGNYLLNPRLLRTVQTRTTTWTGVLNATVFGGDPAYTRSVALAVASDGEAPSVEKALVIGKAQTSDHTLTIEANGCVILKKAWQGTIVNHGLLQIDAKVDVSRFTITGEGTVETIPTPKTYFVETKGAHENIEWNAATKASLEPQGLATEVIDADTLVTFARSPDAIVYVVNSVTAKEIEIVNGATLGLGYWNGTWTVPSNWKVTVEADAKLVIRRWDNQTNKGYVKFGNDVTLNGAGTVTFDPAATDAHAYGLKGTATIEIPSFTTLTVESGTQVANRLTGAGAVKLTDVKQVVTVDANWKGTVVNGVAGTPTLYTRQNPDGSTTYAYTPLKRGGMIRLR